MLQERIAKRARETGGARTDDTAATLSNRISVYRKQTAPVAEYYRGKGTLSTIDGMGTMDEVSAAIGKALDGRAGAAKQG